MRYLSWIVTGILVMGFMAGCVTTKDGDRMQQDLITHQTQLESLQQSLSKKTEDDRVTLEEIRRDLDKLMHHTQLTSASDHVELNRIKRDLLMLNGMVEKNGFDLQQGERKLTEKLQELELRVLVAEAKLGIEPPDKKKKQTTAIVETPLEALPDDPAKLYRRAKVLITKEKNTVEGRRLMALFLKKNGKNKSADNAQYWIGETYYREKNYHQAVMEFQKVVDRFKGGDAVDDALYMLGESFRALGMKDDARLFYEECIERYGKTGSAKKSKAALKKLGK